MYGGRLSSLMVSRCDFTDGSMTLAHIAGSSLDVVETAVLNLTLSWSAIRGISVTRKPDEKPQPSDGRGVRIQAEECVLYNTWFGTDLQGEASIENCQVFSITNLSHDLRVHLTNSMVSEALGATSDLGVKKGEAMLGLLVANAPRTAYRSVPAQVELERRVARAKGSNRPDAGLEPCPVQVRMWPLPAAEQEP
jgi:hypothetical protein